MRCNMTKRLSSLLLAVAILFSALFLNNTNETYAGAKTQNDAILWANSQLGNLLDFDHCYGAQCVDLITSYYDALGVEAAKGDARDYASNELPYGWQRFYYYDGFEVHPGDIAVWTRTGSRCGHVAIVTAFSNNTLNIVEQCGRKKVISYNSYPTSHGVLKCFIRPDFSISSDSRNRWYYDNLGWHNLNSDGSMAKNTWVRDYSGWCYLDSDGNMATNCWQMDSQGWCYLDGSGHAVTNTWMSDSYDWCYLDENGRMAKDKWVAGYYSWYYLDSNGYMARSRWAQDSYGWCYMDANGQMTYSKWKADSYDWCYVGDNGYMVDECWAKDSYDWCYLDDGGHITRQDWVNNEIGDSYVKDNGYITRHWMIIDNEWYYFSNNGVSVTGWQDIGSKRYYFDENGKMLTNQFIGNEWVNESGEYDPTVKPMENIEPPQGNESDNQVAL